MFFDLFLNAPWSALAFFAASILALTLHEFGHAFAATQLGDRTPEKEGRLTLNPRQQVDPIGLLAILFAGFGWARPVRFDPKSLKYKKWGAAMVSAAGPFFNLLALVISMAAMRYLGDTTSGVSIFFDYFFTLNLALLLFNFIPLPPLDGSKALFAAVPSLAFKNVLEKYGPFALIGVMLLDNYILDGVIFSKTFQSIRQAVYSLI